MTQPVFLVAARRSGTTLFRLMLGGHPDVIWQRGWEEIADAASVILSDPSQAQRLRIEDCDPFEAGSAIELRQGISEQIENLLANRNCRLFGATVHVGFASLPDIWPDAKFIHLIRDPRDIAVSYLKLGWAGHAFGAARAWQTAETDWNRVRSRLRDDQYIEMKYESLVEDPKKELRRLCEFLGIDYSDQLFSYVENSNYSMPKKDLAYRWKRQLTEDQTRKIEHGLHELMRDRGYEPAFEATSYSAFQKLLFRQSGIWHLRLRRIKERGLRNVIWTRLTRNVTTPSQNDDVDRRKEQISNLEKNY